MADRYQFMEIGEAADCVREHVLSSHDDFPAPIGRSLVVLTKTGKSPVDLVAGFTKAVYANRGTAGTTAKSMAIACADLIAMKGFHNSLDGKAAGISAALSRDANIPPPAGSTWPSADEDPEPDEAWSPSPVHEPVEAAGAH